VSAIPLELRERDQWIIWRFVDRDGRRTKVPYRADGTGRASTTDPASWSSYDAAVAGAEALAADGIGFVFTADDPFCGVDLDEELTEVERETIALALNSYSERSVSGRGLHVILRASLNGTRRRSGGFEVYDAGRYFVMTGAHDDLSPLTIEERQEQLEAVLAQYLPPEQHLTAGQTLPPQPVDVDDQELLERAFAARNGADARGLWEGLWEGRYSSQSEADLALVGALRFWTGANPARIDALFRRSGLMPPKWDSRRGEGTYGSETIAHAIAAGGDVYTPSEGVTRRSESPESPGVSSGCGGRGDSVTQTLRVTGSTSPHPHHRVGDSDPESARPFAVPVREFVALERPSAEPLLADLDGRAVIGRHSLVLLGATGGHGKTTWFIDLALHWAAGLDYPPFTVPRPVSVLLIENEGPEELFAEKLEQRLASFPHELRAPLDVCRFDWGGFSLADDEHRSRLVEEIAARGYDVVFGDPLDSLGIEGVGSPEDTRKFLALMKETGLNKTVGWWLNTHPRKEKTSEALDEIAGAWGGKPDSVLLLRMLEDDRTQIRFPKLRWAKRGRRPPMLLGFDPDTEAFTYIGEQSDEERDYLAEVVDLLSDGKWRTPKEIAKPKPEGIGANVDTVKTLLEEHVDLFESRTGEAAKAIGRSPSATVWQLAEANDSTSEVEVA
jgi:putative DNA primase/helicase